MTTIDINTGSDKPSRELTPEESARIEELSQDSTKAVGTLPYDGLFQRNLLSALLQNQDLLSKAVGLGLMGNHFSQEAHVIAYNLLADHWKAYQQLAPRFVIQDKLAEATKERDEAVQLHFLAEIASVYDYYVDGLNTAQFLLDELKVFTTAQDIRLKVFTRFDACDKDFRKIAKLVPGLMSDLSTINGNGAADCLQSWSDMVANEEAEAWVVQNWLEFGSLGMLSGDSFAGKSHLLAELVAAIAKYRFFGRYEVPNCPILYIDAENKIRIIRKRISTALGGDESPMESIWCRVDPTRINLPMSVESAPEKIRGLIRQAKTQLKADRILVIVDTMRSIFGADEMEVGDMKDLLYPLQRVSQEENAAILILHHRPKSGAKYSGQTSIPAACDYFWLWESDENTLIGTLSLAGTRGERQRKMKFKLINGRNIWLSDDALGDEKDHIQVLVEQVMVSGLPMKQEDIVDHIRNMWTDGEVPGKTKVREMLVELVGSVILEAPKPDGVKNAKYYQLLTFAGSKS